MEQETEAAESGLIETPWERATSSQRSRRQERSLANEPGGRAQPNSGRPKGIHNDVRLNGFLIEARTTKKKTYRIDSEEFEQIERNAISTPPGSLPGMQIDFEKPTGKTLRLFVSRLEDHLYHVQHIALLEQQLREARRA